MPKDAESPRRRLLREIVEESEALGLYEHGKAYPMTERTVEADSYEAASYAAGLRSGEREREVLRTELALVKHLRRCSRCPYVPEYYRMMCVEGEKLRDAWKEAKRRGSSEAAQAAQDSEAEEGNT